MTSQNTVTLAPGARIVVRDAEWIVRSVNRSSDGGQALSVVGISEIVRDKEAIFLTALEKSIDVLDPAFTKLVHDASSGCAASRLYIESIIRQTPPTGDDLYIGHQAAMDLVPYQLDPALQALKQPRRRILLADAVGLGKTMEAGILISELIRRGRGKRILVLAVKSMLTQFQKELWNHFTIPLTRLDSVGIQRIRAQIPANHNPFYYYDKSIISIDTLKQDAEYRTYIEQAYWDIIVIDEAHNVAERGSGSSMRARLARLLSGRSDTLIMLSATPHDGRARSFASLMNMLNPTAIANPEDYGPDDIKGLFIRRFKKDIKDQVEKQFKERELAIERTSASPAEEAAYDAFSHLAFSRLDRRSGPGRLFKTTLGKSLFSSPAACLSTIQNRIRRLEAKEDPGFDADITSLTQFAEKVDAITASEFTKYRKLLEVIRDPEKGFGWSGRDKTDRLVIFTERIETLKFLEAHLTRDLKLKEKHVQTLSGSDSSMSDIEQQCVVEEFGKDESPVRLLIATDIASEGINLHYLCHRMIHFDIPWSLMVFKQRNGRIDRYGQERTPQIRYLVTDSANEQIRGDTRILELLVEKDKEAEKNIGDPADFMGVYDIPEEERITATAIEERKTPEAFDADLTSRINDSDFDPLSLLMQADDDSISARSDLQAKLRTLPTLFADEYDYFQAAFRHLRTHDSALTAQFDDTEKRVEFDAPEDLIHRFHYLPREIRPDAGRFVLSTDRALMQAEIRRSRKDEHAWPSVHYLWPLNPVVSWINDKVFALFGRHEAPVLTLKNILPPREVVFLLSLMIPNRKGHPIMHRFFSAVYKSGRFTAAEPFETILERAQLAGGAIPNPATETPLDSTRSLLPDAVDRARAWMHTERDAFERSVTANLNEHLREHERLRERKLAELDRMLHKTKQSERVIDCKKEEGRRSINKIFADYDLWIKDTMTLEDSPYIRVIAVLRGE